MEIEVKAFSIDYETFQVGTHENFAEIAYTGKFTVNAFVTFRKDGKIISQLHGDFDFVGSSGHTLEVAAEKVKALLLGGL